MKCVTCDNEITDLKKDFRDDISRKEYGISHLCQKCQDEVFGIKEPEKPEYDESNAIIDWDNARMLIPIKAGKNSKKDEKSLSVRKEYYDNGRVALILNDENGEQYCIATINIPEQILAPNEVIIKDYSENKGVLKALIDAKIVADTGKKVDLPYCQVPICTLLI